MNKIEQSYFQFPRSNASPQHRFSTPMGRSNTEKEPPKTAPSKIPRPSVALENLFLGEANLGVNSGMSEDNNARFERTELKNHISEEKAFSRSLEMQQSKQKTLAMEFEQSHISNSSRQTSCATKNRLKELRDNANNSFELPPEFYHRLIELENELKVLKKTNESLNDEIKSQKKINQILQKKNTQIEADFLNMKDKDNIIVGLKETISSLSFEVETYQAERLSLEKTQREKTKAIEELAIYIENANTNSIDTKLLREELISKEKKILELLEENKGFVRLLTLKEKELSDAHERLKAPGIPFNVWDTERRMLQREITNAQDECTRLKSKNNKLTETNRMLSTQCDFFTGSVRNTKSATPQKKSIECDISEENSTNTNAETEMIMLAQAKIAKYENGINARDKQIAEKNKTIESLEHKLGTIQKVNESTIGRLRKNETHFAKEKKEFQKKIEDLTSQFMEREQELMKEIIELRKPNTPKKSTKK